MSLRNNHDEIAKAEAAELLGVSPRTVERYLAAGTLTPVRFHNGRVKVLRTEVEALLEPTDGGGPSSPDVDGTPPPA